MANKTVTKRDLSRAVAEKHNIVQAEAKSIIQTVLDQIIEEIGKGNRLELRDFGVFEPRARAARKARNPRTSATVHVGPKAVIGFKAGKQMSIQAQKALKTLQKDA